MQWSVERLEPLITRSEVRRSNHPATTPHYACKTQIRALCHQDSTCQLLSQRHQEQLTRQSSGQGVVNGKKKCWPRRWQEEVLACAPLDSTSNAVA